MDYRVRRTRAAEHTITVKVRVATGTVTQQQASEWVQEALDRHHQFRAGHVARSPEGGIKRPTVQVD